ncbi:MAG: hypothetical protein ACM3JK_03380 [Betaproteobacteria bacterium]
MNWRLFFFALLAALLFFGQQGAAVHAIFHLAESLPGQSQQDKNLPHSPACDKCVVYAGVGSAVATTSFSFAGCAGTPLQQAVLPASAYYLTSKVYFSGAPPPRS